MTPLILHGKFVLPMTAGNPLIENGAILVGADGRIEQVGDATAVLAAHPGVAVKRCDNALLMPGLVNTHAHSGLLRGTAEGLPVWDWLEQFIDPMHRVVQPHEAEIASLAVLRRGAAVGHDHHRGHVALTCTAARGQPSNWASARCWCPTWGSIPTTIISRRSTPTKR